MTPRAYCPHEQRYPLEIVTYLTPLDEPVTAGRGIVRDPFGEPTGHYEDGTTGVPESEQALARDDDGAMCRSCGAEIEWEHAEARAVVALVVEIDAADVDEAWHALAESVPGVLFASSPLALKPEEIDSPAFDVDVTSQNAPLRRTFEVD